MSASCPPLHCSRHRGVRALLTLLSVIIAVNTFVTAVQAAAETYDLPSIIQSPYSHQHPQYAADAVANLTAWRSTLFKRISMSRGNTPLTMRQHYHWVFNEFGPFVQCPPGSSITSFGLGDGIKWTCGYPTDDTNCVIYSLGSHMDFSFEKDVLDRTNCQVHTFDCSCNGKSIHPRHTFHKICIGSAKNVWSAGGELLAMSLADIAKMLNHTEITAMKMDIEGSEFESLSEWLATDAMLPLQLNVELHHLPNHLYKVKDDLFDVTLFLAHLTQLGYAIASKVNNPHCNLCSELLLLRVQTFNGIRTVQLPRESSFPSLAASPAGVVIAPKISPPPG